MLPDHTILMSIWDYQPGTLKASTDQSVKTFPLIKVSTWNILMSGYWKQAQRLSVLSSHNWSVKKTTACISYHCMYIIKKSHITLEHWSQFTVHHWLQELTYSTPLITVHHWLHIQPENEQGTECLPSLCKFRHQLQLVTWETLCKFQWLQNIVTWETLCKFSVMKM
jgi:hypothetical protein